MERNLKTLLLVMGFLTITTAVKAQNNNNNVSLITVTGESTVYVKPDEVTLTFGVETKNADPKIAKSSNDKLMNEIHQYLKSQKIDPKNIQTDYVRLNSMYIYNEKERQEEYVAVNTVSLKLTDINQYEKIASGLLERGINKINQVTFSSSKLKEYQAEARILAVKNAQEKAKSLAEAIGQSIGKAYYINENTSPIIPYPRVAMEMKAMSYDASGGEEATIAPGEMEIKGNVTASFVLN